MNRICTFSSKGGAGKTTLSIVMALGMELPLCDLDPQRTASHWLGRRKVPHPVADARSSHWVADCPPKVTGELIPVLAASELVVIPVRAAFNDLDALPDTVRFVEANTTARLAFHLSDIDGRTNDEDMLRSLLRDYGFPVLGVFSHRVAYSRAGIGGHLPGEIDAVAGLEMDNLLAALKDIA